MDKPSPSHKKEITELDQANIKALLARVFVAKLKKAKLNPPKFKLSGFAL